MNDPLLSLSFSLHSNKGVYALMLGSGVSRGAQIPTGWEVLEDLLRQVALLENEDPGSDPAAWYKKKYGETADYSKILDTLAKSPAERSNLLRKYFEPTGEERERAEKLPTAAHKAIARLVASGYIKVIVTTNFDRLIEMALEEVGISPVVISSPDGIKGAPPLAHSQCTVIKLHGDYIDMRLRNTADELSGYDPATNKLLDQIFDEYGLVISGWSGEWDTALRAALERCKSHRFTTYWTTRSKLGELAEPLATLRRAQVVTIKTADSFFGELEQKISALEEYDKPHPLSVKTAVVTLKRSLVDDRYRIQLHDLLSHETEKAYEELSKLTAQVGHVDADFCYQRLKHYEATMEMLQALIAAGTYFGEPKHASHWTKILNRTAAVGEGAGTELLLHLQRYPALILLYAGGLAAIASERYYNLKALFDAQEKEPHHDPVPITTHVSAAIVDGDTGNKITKSGANLYTPISEYLLKNLREPLRELIPGNDEFDGTFDRLECLISMEVASRQKPESPWFWTPLGRFGWKHSRADGKGVLDTIEKEIQQAGDSWLPVKAGVFASAAVALAAVQKVKEQVEKTNWW